jgi:hypothetical protein
LFVGSGDGPVSAAPILPIIPPQSAERWKNNGNEITRIFNDVLLELMVSQVPVHTVFYCVTFPIIAIYCNRD